MAQGFDPYPKFDLGWFMAEIEAMVSNPEAANVGRVRGRFDLQLVIVVAEEDRHIFTDEVCIELQERVKKKSGVFAPLVYLDGSPHEQVKEAMEYADRWI